MISVDRALKAYPGEVQAGRAGHLARGALDAYELIALKDRRFVTKDRL